MISLLFALALALNESEVTLDNYLFSVQEVKHITTDIVDEGYDLLERELKKPGLNLKEKKQILQLHLFLVKNDKTNYSTELLAKWIRQNQNIYDAFLNTLPAADKDLLQERLRVFERETKSGNG